jgi:hypothetical protein
MGQYTHVSVLLLMGRRLERTCWETDSCCGQGRRCNISGQGVSGYFVWAGDLVRCERTCEPVKEAKFKGTDVGLNHNTYA